MAQTSNDIRVAALDMLGCLRTQPVQPYRDGRPVLRVINVVGRRTGEPRPFGVNVTAAGRCRVERDGPVEEIERHVDKTAVFRLDLIPAGE